MPPKKRSVKSPSEVPKLIISGGIEVLGLRTGPDSITEVEAILNPRMGLEPTDDYYGFSGNITVAKSKEEDKPPRDQLPCYSVAKIELPMLNDDLTCENILMWECISVKTEVVGIGTLCAVHSFAKRESEQAPAMPVVGMNFHFFAVGGEPLDMKYIVTNSKAEYPENTAFLPGSPASAQVWDPNLKTLKLTTDGSFPVEAWHPDPTKNENVRYFGSYTGGLNTPPVYTFTNTVTTILLNENGVGPLCKGDQVFIASADITGFQVQPDGQYRFRGFPRYFKLTMRKRLVRNPYPVSTLLSTLFSQLGPSVQGQDMTKQVEEVKIFEGVEKLPGDPDLIRYRSQFGQEKTIIPIN
ncbi:VP1 [Betapolyomavirus calbifrons]|uniref:Major capsid protein VP1 n=1 Tax=Betapolyomavirus calbifrons TaxID=1236392 RepID=K7QJ85_9POLY|nr:VP1 [Betapolyomavirus calbifrons]AFU25613.1 VP1 [Betapolyomavirus calbifrons]